MCCCRYCVEQLLQVGRRSGLVVVGVIAKLDDVAVAVVVDPCLGCGAVLAGMALEVAVRVATRRTWADNVCGGTVVGCGAGGGGGGGSGGGNSGGGSGGGGSSGGGSGGGSSSGGGIIVCAGVCGVGLAMFSDCVGAWCCCRRVDER